MKYISQKLTKTRRQNASGGKEGYLKLKKLIKSDKKVSKKTTKKLICTAVFLVIFLISFNVSLPFPVIINKILKLGSLAGLIYILVSLRT